ncbi:MAG: hypothetical protein WDM96_18015 [Lacunisphaera sp.]
MVNQELAIAPHLSVTENIVLGAEPGAGPLRPPRPLARDRRARPRPAWPA